MAEQTTNQLTSEQIARAAYLLWEREGRPHGQDLNHWLQAERQLSPGPDSTASAQDGSARPTRGTRKRAAATRRVEL